MKLASSGNADADSRLVAQDLDVMPEILRCENDIAGLDPMRFGSVLVVPG